MDKTIKISVEMHKKISVRAATLGVKKSELCEALLHFGLQERDREVLEYIVTNHDINDGSKGE